MYVKLRYNCNSITKFTGALSVTIKQIKKKCTYMNINIYREEISGNFLFNMHDVMI